MARRHVATWVILVLTALCVAVPYQPAQAGSTSTTSVPSQYVSTTTRNLDLWGDVWTAAGGGRVTSLYVSCRAYNGHRVSVWVAGPFGLYRLRETGSTTSSTWLAIPDGVTVTSFKLRVQTVDAYTGNGSIYIQVTQATVEAPPFQPGQPEVTPASACRRP